MTISEPDAEGGQPSVLVIVPDSQLSLAIGKRGQNARLAAKLTGLRVDIKSESEVEDERRREDEELAQGRQFLSAFPDVTPSIQDALIAAGLSSPARIARADLAALADVAGLGERKAKSLLEAAQAWVAEHAAVLAAQEAIAVEDGSLRRRIVPQTARWSATSQEPESSVNGGGVTTRPRPAGRASDAGRLTPRCFSSGSYATRMGA